MTRAATVEPAVRAGPAGPPPRETAGPWPLVARALLGPGVPALVAVTAAALFFTSTLISYLTYHTAAYDLAFFDQVVERTAQGHPFQTSFLGYSFLGQHWEPVLLLWAGLDRLMATPIWLLAVSAAALALAPLAAWRLARAWLGPSWAAPVAALACLADPLMTQGAAFSYHSETLTPVLALTALDGAARGHRWRFLVPALALALVKEDAFLVAAGVGWIAWAVQRRRDGLLLCGGMLAGFAVVVGAVMPALRGGEAGDLAGLYAYLGGTTPAAVLGGLLTHPERALGHLAGTEALHGAAAALLPLVLLPLLAGRAALALVPVLGVALLSASPWQSQLLFHYGLEAFPLLLACALLGWRRIRDRLPCLEPALVAGTAAALLAAYVLGSPLPGGAHAHTGDLQGLDRRAAVEALLARVPGDASVTASSGMVAHVSARAAAYEFPDRAFETEYVLLDTRGPRSSWTASWWWDAAARRLPEHGYRVVGQAAGVVLWTRLPSGAVAP